MRIVTFFYILAAFESLPLTKCQLENLLESDFEGKAQLLGFSRNIFRVGCDGGSWVDRKLSGSVHLELAVY